VGIPPEALATLWELVEWTASLTFGARVNSSLDDANTDLLANSAGAVVAALLVLVVRSGRGGEPSQGS
jgi:uncharacterized membrane protein YjdF